MTGETYSVLRRASILGRLMAAGDDPTAFDEGVLRGLATGSPGELLHRLFAVRTRVLFDEMAPEGAADHLSGLLIGSEVAAGLSWASSRGAANAPLWLVGEPALCRRYEVALRLAGRSSITAPADAAARGLWRVARDAGLVHERAQEARSC